MGKHAQKLSLCNPNDRKIVSCRFTSHLKKIMSTTGNFRAEKRFFCKSNGIVYAPTNKYQQARIILLNTWTGLCILHLISRMFTDV